MAKRISLRIFIFILFSSPFALTACGGPAREAVLKDIRDNPGAGAFIKDVPFYPQNDSMCGPAAIASVAGFYGDKVTLGEAARGVYLAKLKGTLPVDLLIYAKEKGFNAEYYQGGFKDLKARISEGRPLILFLNLGFESYPVGHYITAVGFDDGLKAVIAHSGMNREEVFTYERLAIMWEKTGYAALLVTPGAEKTAR
ncbi:MAG: C39 family peptidase [Deltaproteobacteria bacterium]|nr:C39 family peptidase [Deltaproteobacteria bacterium]